MLIQLYTQKRDEPDIVLTLAKVFFFAVVVVLTIYFFTKGQNRTYGFLTMGASFVVVLFLQMAWPGPVPVIVLNDEGIFDRRAGFGLIRWQDIVSAQLEVKGPFICLRVKDPEVYISRLPLAKRKALEFHQDLGFRMLNLEINNLIGHPLDLLALIRKQIEERNDT